MKFLGIDETLAGLKRGAEKFGGKIAAKVVKKMAVRVNGLAQPEPEPYGLGMGGADTEQMSQPAKENVKIGIPVAQLRQKNKLDFLKRELPLSQDTAERTAIEYEIAGIEKELAEFPSGDPDARQEKTTSTDGLKNEDSSALGFDSAQKSTTAERSDYENAMSYEAAKNILKDLEIGMPDDGHIKVDLLSPAEYSQYKEAMLVLGLKPKVRENEPTPGTTADKDDVNLENAGHLSPDSWEAASTDERRAWLESANLNPEDSTKRWFQLSSEAHLALQDEIDKPASVNNAADKCAECGEKIPEGTGRIGYDGGKCFHDECYKKIHNADDGPSDQDVQAKAWEMFKQHWDGLSSAQQDSVYKSLGFIENAAGKPGKKNFVFKDVQGEEESVPAESLDQAWDMLANNFGEPVATLKKIGVKFVRENDGGVTEEMDNAEDHFLEPSSSMHGPESAAVKCPTTRDHETANLKNGKWFCGGCGKQLDDSKLDLENAPSDVEEIERHVEGIEHELSEMKGIQNSGVKRGTNRYGTRKNYSPHDAPKQFKPGDMVVIKLSDGDKEGKFVKYDTNYGDGDEVVTVEQRSTMGGQVWKKNEQYQEHQLRKA